MIMEQMTPEQVAFEEKKNSNTTKTNNAFFEENGYLIIRNIYDPQKLKCQVPKERGTIEYWGKTTNEKKIYPEERQVPGSLARYSHPEYREIHSEIRTILETELGKKLYNTYFYDRFYFPGQELQKHVDRPACEISITIHIGTDLKGKKADWPIWIKTPDLYADDLKKIITTPGAEKSVILNPGDGLVYKGCERPHWREKMPDCGWFKKLIYKTKDPYYHQIFFHYVLQDGQRAHCAFDATR